MPCWPAFSGCVRPACARAVAVVNDNKIIIIISVVVVIDDDGNDGAFDAGDA